MTWLRNLFLFCFSFLFVQCGYGEEGLTVDQYQFRGKHFLASYCDCDHEAICNIEKLKEAMLFAVQTSGATILESVEHVFPPDGLTMVILLSESHASIHTYPEYNSCFVDLFTCGIKCSSEEFDKTIREYLKPTYVNQTILMRNEEIQEL